LINGSLRPTLCGLYKTIEKSTSAAAFKRFSISSQGVNKSLRRALEKPVIIAVGPRTAEELKANQNYLNLQEQLEGTENRINQERRVYNDEAAKFNKVIVVFPNVFFARMFNLKAAELFKAAETAETAPAVKFD